MKKLYGYKEKDILGFMNFLKNHKGNMSSAFSIYAKKVGKAKGTIRNMYYALAKTSKEDNVLQQKYLSGKSILVNEIVAFSKEEEKELVKQILILKGEGFSVRKAVFKLANGNAKLALRYQNKYRNSLKNKSLVEEVLKEVNLRVGNKNILPFIKSKKIADSSLEKLKAEIDGLVERISVKLQKENKFLKERIARLELENYKLNTLLFGEENKSKIPLFMLTEESKKVLS